jgi:N6-adenosine-specific RNA methylase IME4
MSLRKGVDTDVVVAEVRETSRKPDEVYGVIERYVMSSFILELMIDSRHMGEDSSCLEENIILVRGG